MWNHFTERAKRVICYAQIEADRVDDNVSTEHILLGLLRDEECKAVQAIRLLGFSEKRLCELVRASVPIPANLEANEEEQQGGKSPISSNSDKTNNAHHLARLGKRVIDLAYEESQAMQDEHIGTEHLLLGVVREPNGVAGIVLRHAGMDLVQLRNSVLRLKGSWPPPAKGPGAISPISDVPKGCLASLLPWR